MVAARQLERFLAEEWGRGLRLTTIPQAMHRLGIADDPRVRWRVARLLSGWWRNALSSQEKRLEVAAAIGRDVDEVQDERWRQQVVT